MNNLISTLLPNVQLHAPVSEQTLQDLIRYINLPLDYINVLRLSNGLEAEINEIISLVLWEAESLIESNQGYKIEEFAPDCFLIGSNRGETAYGLDMRQISVSHGYYLARPFISTGWDEVTILGSRFQEFIEAIKVLS